jgi:hypothetical protein
MAFANPVLRTSTRGKSQPSQCLNTLTKGVQNELAQKNNTSDLIVTQRDGRAVVDIEQTRGIAVDAQQV